MTIYVYIYNSWDIAKTIFWEIDIYTLKVCLRKEEKAKTWEAEYPMQEVIKVTPEII